MLSIYSFHGKYSAVIYTATWYKMNPQQFVNVRNSYNIEDMKNSKYINISCTSTYGRYTRVGMFFFVIRFYLRYPSS